MDASKALMIVAAVAAYKGIRFISRSLHAFHPITVDGSVDYTVPISTDSSSLSLDITDVSPPATKHDVFLSFRGEDTRDNFTSHLYEALCRAKIQTYIDNHLDRGEQISPVLQKTIKESNICVIIFSKDFASSIWCLNELVKILECKQKYGRIVLPIFYNIDPSNIRKQSGSFRDPFIKYEQRFKNNKHKVQRWKDALTEAANLSGWDSTKLRPESTFIAKIVDDILKKLNRISSYHFEGLVGIHPRVEYIESLLSTADVRTLGIWGMGGIGKTTIAKLVFDKLNSQFESCCFEANVREQIASIGLDRLQSKCLSKILDGRDSGTYNINSTYVQNRLQRKKILLVLDDVDNSTQAEDLTKMCEWFGLGSRTIITSRDLQVLKNAAAYITYHVEEMNFNDALELFNLKAFKQREPVKNFTELSEQGVKYCQGVPLALKVLGSFLYGRAKDAWESTFEKLKKAPFLEIFDVLKLSFDGLDQEEKDIFLDMACFFFRGKINLFGEIEDYYGLSANIVINVLLERSLISVDKYGKVIMHDLVKAMAQEVARQQYINKVGNPIRLWQQEDIYHILKNKTGDERIRSMSIDMCKIKKIELTAGTFEKMYNIRFLDFGKSDYREPSNVYIHESLEYLPEELKILKLDYYPSPMVPLRFCAENLVHLIMPDSNLEQLWDGDLHFPNLKSIDLAGSEQLIRLPDLSQTPNIQYIDLADCVNLVHVHSSNPLVNLRVLCMRSCFKLRRANLKSNIHATHSKLLFINHYLIKNMQFLEVCMKVLLSKDGNICGFKYEGVSVYDGNNNIYDIFDDDEELKCLASSLPFVPQVCWLDFPSFVEIGRQHFETYVDYLEPSPMLAEDMLSGLLEVHRFEMRFPEPDMFEDAKGVMYSSKRETTMNDVILCADEWMSPDPENKRVECEGYFGFSKIWSIPRWSFLRRLSLQKGEKLRSHISSLRCRQLRKFEFTLSFSSEWPSSNLAPQMMQILKHNVFGDFLFSVDSYRIWYLIPY